MKSVTIFHGYWWTKKVRCHFRQILIDIHSNVQWARLCSNLFDAFVILVYSSWFKNVHEWAWIISMETNWCWPIVAIFNGFIETVTNDNDHTAIFEIIITYCTAQWRITRRKCVSKCFLYHYLTCLSFCVTFKSIVICRWIGKNRAKSQMSRNIQNWTKIYNLRSTHSSRNVLMHKIYFFFYLLLSRRWCAVGRMFCRPTGLIFIRSIFAVAVMHIFGVGRNIPNGWFYIVISHSYCNERRRKTHR